MWDLDHKRCEWKGGGERWRTSWFPFDTFARVCVCVFFIKQIQNYEMQKDPLLRKRRKKERKKQTDTEVKLVQSMRRKDILAHHRARVFDKLFVVKQTKNLEMWRSNCGWDDGKNGYNTVQYGSHWYNCIKFVRKDILVYCNIDLHFRQAGARSCR